MSLKDLIAPFFVWQRAFEKPYTVSLKPIEERPGAPAYRGFHINLSEDCVGCGSCFTICQNHAIDMVEVESLHTASLIRESRRRCDRGAHQQHST